MSSESKLMKDWKHSDVQRMRNLVTKNYSDKTVSQVGYTKKYVERKEGDVWEENGKTWTLKNGIKMTVTKLDLVKKTLQTPLTCPKCSKPMNKGRIDKYMYSIHKTCSDCVFEHETKLKLSGKFEEYQQNMIKQGLKYHATEIESLLLEIALMDDNESFVTEAGDIESWKGKGLDKQKITQELQEYLQKIKDAANS